MQIVERANPDGCAKEQPLKKYRAADIIRLECSEAPFDKLRMTKNIKRRYLVMLKQNILKAKRNEAVLWMHKPDRTQEVTV